MFTRSIIILLLNLLTCPVLWASILQDHAQFANSGMRNMHIMLEDRLEKRRDAIKLELARISKLYDSGKMGAATFETQKNLLVKELDDMQKSADQVGAAATNIITNGFAAVMAIEQKRQTAEEDRKTAIAAAAATQAVADEGAMKRLQFLTEPHVLLTAVKYGTIAVAGGTAAYFGTKATVKYVEQKLEKQPAIVQETSRVGILSRAATTITSWWQGHKKEKPALSKDLIFAPEVQKRFEAIGNRTGELFGMGLPFPITLLSGPPGTGKTAFARWLAHNTGMDYALMAASDLLQLPMGEDITQLRELFAWAKTCPKGMIIFIDEIDAIGFDRKRNPDRRVVILLTELLTLMSDPETKRNCKIIIATNRKEDLDEALRDRAKGEDIYVGLPAQAEREQIFKIYLNKCIVDFKVPIKKEGKQTLIPLTLDADVTDEVIAQAAKKIDGFSGRNIEQMVQQMQIECCFSDYVLNKALFMQVVDTAIKDRAKS